MQTGSTVAYQYTDSTVGLVMEVRRGADPSVVFDEMKSDAVFKLINDSHGVCLGAIRILKPGVVPKTNSGKVERAKTKKLTVNRAWRLSDILYTWSIPATNPTTFAMLPDRESVDQTVDARFPVRPQQFLAQSRDDVKRISNKKIAGAIEAIGFVLQWAILTLSAASNLALLNYAVRQESEITLRRLWWLPLALVLLFMISLSMIVVVLKWFLIGQYRER